MKRLLSVLLVLCLLLSGLAITASAETTTIASGITGRSDSLTWTLDSAGTLTISGEGEMTSTIYMYNEWWPYRQDIIHVVVEKGVTSIGDQAFNRLENVESVSIADTVLKIGKRAFANCHNLTEVIIPDSVTIIEEEAFDGCRGLKTVELGDGIITIGIRAFWYCSSLSEITIGSSVRTIETGAFQGCESLESVAMMEGVTYIGEHAFWQTALKKVYIPASVSDLVNSPFGCCADLEMIQVDPANPYYTNDERGVLYNKEMTKLLQAPGTISGSFVIPNIVEFVDNETFYKCNDLTEVTVPASVTSISSYAFGECASLKKMTIDSTADMWLSNDFACDSRALKTIIFTGDAPIFCDSTFFMNELTAYYPADNDTWTADVMQDYGGTVTWLAGTGEETTQPEAPSVKISNVSSSGKIKLSWNAVEGATEYKVYRATSKTGTYKRLTTTSGTSLTNTSAEVGTQYYYYVVAVNASGLESEKSNIVTRTCDLPRPEVKISVVSSTGKLKLRWDAIDGATKYEVHHSKDGGKTYSLLKTTTGTSLTNTSITAGNKYYYKVKAIHSKSSANSAFSSAKYGTCDLPKPELKISVVSSTGKLKLRWDAVDGAVKYEVHRSTDGGKTYSLLKTTTGTSLTNTSITAGNKYYYKVKAIHSNTAANSAFSSAKYGTCDLARPTATVKLNSSGKPVVSWGKVAGAVKYTVYIYDADGELVKTSSTTSLKLTHGSAVKGKTYSYRVVAVHSNTAANSAKSIAVSIKSK